MLKRTTELQIKIQVQSPLVMTTVTIVSSATRAIVLGFFNLPPAMPVGDS